MGSGFAAAFRRCDRGQDASEYGMLLAMVVLIVISGAIFLARSVNTSMETTAECIEYASAEVTGSDDGATVRVEEEKTSLSLADRLAAAMQTGSEASDSRDSRAARGGTAGTARNLPPCPPK